MANGFNPYSILPVNKLGFQSDIEKKQQATIKDLSLGKWKEKLGKDYQKELNEIIAKAEAARKRASKRNPFQKAVMGISKLLGPLGTGIASGLEGIYESEQQRKALKKYMDYSKLDKYKGTYLAPEIERYKKEAKKAQVKTGQSLLSGILGGTTDFLGSKLFGTSKTLGKGLLKDIFTFDPGVVKYTGKEGAKSLIERPGRGLVKNIYKETKDYVTRDILKGIGTSSPIFFGDLFKEKGKFKKLFKAYAGLLSKEQLEKLQKVSKAAATLESSYASDPNALSNIEGLKRTRRTRY